MKKKYSALLRAGENIGAAILLTGAIFALRIIPEMQGMDIEFMKNLAREFFSTSLIFVAGLIFCINAINWYFVEDAVRITMGGTRKKIFIEMQITKLVSAAVIYVVVLLTAGDWLKKIVNMKWLFWGFAVLMIVQALAEFAIMVWFRFRKMGIIMMTVASAAFGFCIAYGVLSFMNTGVFCIDPEFGILMSSPVGSAVMLFVLYHVLVIVSWSLWERAEITL